MQLSHVIFWVIHLPYMQLTISILNPSSTTAMTSFHGTSISYLQQPDENSVQRPFFELSNQGYRIKLPESYTSIRNIEVNLARTEAPPKRVFHPHYDGETEVKQGQHL